MSTLPPGRLTRSLVAASLERDLKQGSLQPPAKNVQTASIQPAVEGDLLGMEWVKSHITYQDFGAAANTEAITLFRLPARSVITACLIWHSQSFNGGAITSYTLSVGVPSDVTRFAAVSDVFVAPADYLAYGYSRVGIGDLSAGEDVICEAIADQFVQTATHGVTDIWCLVSRLP